jgi:hypothetical protein
VTVTNYIYRPRFAKRRRLIYSRFSESFDKVPRKRLKLKPGDKITSYHGDNFQLDKGLVAKQRSQSSAVRSRPIALNEVKL